MKTVFITGASSGIGEACALAYAKLNYKIIICARRIERIRKLEKELLIAGASDVYGFELDVRKRENVQKAVANIPQTLQQIDILVNNAGLAAGKTPIQNADYRDWDAMIDTNVKGLLYVSEAVTKIMIEEETEGHIVNIASIAGKEVYPMGNVYCATKHAVDALSRAQRVDLLPHGIRVTNIAPGAVETEFSLVRFKGDEEKAKAVYEGYNALKAEDIAETIVFATSTPKHVCLSDITIMPAAQGSSKVTHKK